MHKSIALLVATLCLITPFSQGRDVNDASLSLIKSFEGFFRNFYIDPVGIRTIGYGHACHVWDCNNLQARNAQGTTYRVFAPLTEPQAADLLRADLGKYGDCVLGAVSKTLTDNQFGALVSFTFNVGCGGFQGSSLRKDINAGASAETIRADFMKWVKGGGQTLPGLVRRRSAEADLYLGGGGGGGSGSDGVGQSCTEPKTGRKGVCSTSCNGGTQVSGLCPGDSSVRCCIGQSCTVSGQSGKCSDSSMCSGTSLSGGCPGDANYKCCVTTTSSPTSAPPAAISPCPNGATFDSNLGFCKDSQNLYGPFSNKMTLDCVGKGGGEVGCKKEWDVTIQGTAAKIQRWALAFGTSIRGTADCPPGTAVDSNYMGHCIETVDGKVNVFGPFSESLVQACKNAKGGSACLTVRWSGPFFRSVAIGATYFDVYDVDDTSDNSTFPEAIIGEQVELSQEVIVPDSSVISTPILSLISFLTLFVFFARN